jgi:methionyl-tRNA formyltransferase
MNILFLGSSGPLSVIPLKSLLQSGHNLCAIGYESGSKVSLSNIKHSVIAGQNETIEMLARMESITGITLFDDSDDYVDAIKAHEPDIIIVSCLEKKLPNNVLNIPRLGCFNLHPSLLPSFRGPVPLFWQFREGIEDFGITLHRMSADFDSGAIIAQSRLSMPDGVNNQHASVLLAKAGALLLEENLREISQGEIAELKQNESEASYMSYPGESDFEISPAWNARRMYNFICATTHWGNVYPCEIQGCVYQISEATSYMQMTSPETQFNIDKKVVTIPCADGVVSAKLA